MDKNKSRQILALNMARFMQTRGIDSQNQLAGKANVAQSHVGRIIRGESAATVDMIDAIAQALGVEAWELLADDETTRRAAMERMLLGPRVSNERAAEQLPPAPTIEPAPKKRPGPKPKKRPRGV